MNKILKGMLVVAGLVAAAPGMAATTWSFDGGGNSTSNTYGNKRTYTNDSVTVTASAWSNTSGSANVNLENAYLGYYSGNGLGVSNRDEGLNPGSPNHSNDNNGRYDSILLSFSEAVNLESVKNGWWTNDSDLTVAAYLGAGNSSNLTGNSYSDLVNGSWANIASLSNPKKNLTGTGSTTYSSYWLIGAINPAFAGSVDGKSDYTKLYAVKGTICTAPGGASGGVCGGQPGTGVSEPGSLALAGLGLLGVIGLRRRQH